VNASYHSATVTRVAEITLDEHHDPETGAVIRVALSFEAGRLAIDSRPLPEGALEAVLKRFGKPLESAEVPAEEALELDDGKRLVRFRFLRRYDVIARDYVVLFVPGEEPLCDLATSVAAALDHLSRAFA
jgi:hypothetical protein